MAFSRRALTDESEVVIATRGVGDSGATVDGDAERGRVQAVSAIDGRIEVAKGVADTDGVTDVATAVDVADGDGTTVGRGRRYAAVAGGGDVGETVVPTTKESVL